MFIEGLKALAKDEQTRVILLVSKPPHPAVLGRIEKVAKGIRKPIVTLFIGVKTSAGSPATLEEAALQAVALSQGRQPDAVAQRWPPEMRSSASLPGAKRRSASEARSICGAFSAEALFCAEAQILFKDMLANVHSNAPVKGAKQLRDSLVSQKNTVIDLGEDEFTVGRPHPMIDYSLRNSRILKEAADAQTAVILLDIVLGYGSNLDPAGEISEVLRQAARKVSVVCSITGTDEDPQNRRKVEAALRKAGAIVMPSNAAACIFAGRIIQCLGRGSKNKSSK